MSRAESVACADLSYRFLWLNVQPDEVPDLAKIRRLILDVLKPHHPNIVELAGALTAQEIDCAVRIKVLEMDDKTETLEIVVEGADIHFDGLVESIKKLGGSLHSIDEVVAVSDDSEAQD